MAVNRSMPTGKPQRLSILFVLALALTFTALYAMFWAQLYNGDCCRVSVWYDLPNVVLLALTLAAVYIALKTASFSRLLWVRLGLCLIALALLVEIPAKIYLGGHGSPIYLNWYPLFPAMFLGMAGIALGLQKHTSTAVFFVWNLWLLTGAIAFRANSSLLFSGWDTVFSMGLVGFMIWLLVNLASITHFKGENHGTD